MPYANNMREIKVLLITSVSCPGFYIAPPIGLYRLKHYLNQRGFGCDILDLDLCSKSEYIQKAKEGYYNVIGFSVSHYNMTNDLEAIQEFRQIADKNCLFIAGGQEATLNYKQWLGIGLIDIILMGFAEKNLYKLCVRLSKEKKCDLRDVIKNIDGTVICGRYDEFIYHPAAPLTDKEFQELSFTQIMSMDIPYENYWAKVRNEISEGNFNGNEFIIETVRLYTSSHCPRRCGFCSSQAFIPMSQNKKSPIFMLSARQIHQLILHYVKKYRAKGFLFSDDDFPVGTPLGIKRLFDLCQLINDSKNKGEIPKNIRFNCQARIADFLVHKVNKKKEINQPLLESLRVAGFNSFGLGVETFSSELLKSKSINKVGVSEEDCRMVINALLKNELIPQINIIIGIPESSVDELIHSMKIAAEYVRQGCQVAVTALLKSIPGAPIYNSKDYKVKVKEWKNPVTGENLIIQDYFVPKNPVVASIAENIEELSGNELKRLKRNTPWKDSIVPKFLVGMSMFISVAKFLNRPDLIYFFEEITNESLGRKHSRRKIMDDIIL